jgi:hypothetical protein
MALLLMGTRIMLPPEAVTVLGAVWLLIVLPSFVCATALMIYCARKTGRGAESWTGELAFWSVVPVGAFIMLWVF